MGKLTTKLETKTVNSVGKEIKKTVTYANPEASNANLSGFAKALNALSSNTFNSVMRIDRRNISDEIEEQKD